MDQYRRAPDLEPDERSLDRLLAATVPVAPPIGFRDSVMRGIRAERPRTTWEWIVAAVLALPSLAYLAWALATNGSDFVDGLSNAFAAAAQGAGTEEFFFVDGLVVLAVALIGIASIVAAHASLVPLGGAGAKPPRRAGTNWFNGARLH